MNRKIMIFLTLSLGFTGCTSMKIKKQESAFIVLKTKMMKYADMGFITDREDLLKVEIYASGQPLVGFEINPKNVCMSTFKCMDKKSFNIRALSEHYPDALLENVFRANPIFEKESLVHDADGFSQKFKKENLYNISYTVKGKERIFRDTMNKILIKVREQ